MRLATTIPGFQQLKLPAFIIAVLAAGATNYFFVRPGIALFRAFSIREEPLFTPGHPLRFFFNGYFSDIAWCIALCATILLLIRKGLLDIPGSLMVLALPFLAEAGQYFHFMPGTFDWYDMLVYAGTEFIFIYRILKQDI
jgi:hypothetical protein